MATKINSCVVFTPLHNSNQLVVVYPKVLVVVSETSFSLYDKNSTNLSNVALFE